MGGRGMKSTESIIFLKHGFHRTTRLSERLQGLSTATGSELSTCTLRCKSPRFSSPTSTRGHQSLRLPSIVLGYVTFLCLGFFFPKMGRRTESTHGIWGRINEAST